MGGTRSGKTLDVGEIRLDETPFTAIRGLRIWLGISLFWVFFGFLIGNHLAFSMRSHGHDWGRIVLWQIAGASAWILLTPAVFALDRRFSIRTGLRGLALPVHAAAAVVFALAHLVPLTHLSRRLDPFRPVARETTFLAEYRALAAEWIPLDVLVYAGILAFVAVLAARQEHVHDRLRAARLSAELAAARLRALELEIRPHFLFNSLNAIHQLVRSGDRERASEILIGLADLLRATLREHGRQLVSLREELDLVELYLSIQNVRFSDRLRVEIVVREDAAQAPVPFLILQPLVENAIRHGIERRADAKRVEVRARLENDRLRIEVIDDGPGPVSAGESSRPGPSDGIGLINVRSRLQALYRNRALLEIQPDPEGGTRSVLELPLEASES